jgi:hypothetical protein
MELINVFTSAVMAHVNSLRNFHLCFDVLLTVPLSIILLINQFNTQIIGL